KPQKAGDQVRTGSEPEDTQWEMCQIEQSVIRRAGYLGGGAQWNYRAEAVGPIGSYIAAQSPVLAPGWGSNTDAEERHIVDDLVQKLAADGWEPLPKGG